MVESLKVGACLREVMKDVGEYSVGGILEKVEDFDNEFWNGGASLGLNKFTDAVLTMSDMVCTSTASRLKIMRCAVFSANYILVLVLCPVGIWAEHIHGKILVLSFYPSIFSSNCFQCQDLSNK